jgi:hypothetical protein
MRAEEIRGLTIDTVDGGEVGGTGPEEEFRNLMLQEIAAQLSELVAVLKERAGESK